MSNTLPIVFVDPRIRPLLQKYRSSTTGPTLSEPVKHDILHYINTTGSLTFCKVRLLPPWKLATVWQVFADVRTVIDLHHFKQSKRFQSGTPFYSSTILLSFSPIAIFSRLWTCRRRITKSLQLPKTFWVRLHMFRWCSGCIFLWDWPFRLPWL